MSAIINVGKLIRELCGCVFLFVFSSREKKMVSGNRIHVNIKHKHNTEIENGYCLVYLLLTGRANRTSRPVVDLCV